MAEKEKDELEKMNEAIYMYEKFFENYKKKKFIGLMVIV